VLDENFGKSFSYALGKAIPMKSGAAFYEGQLKNLMPVPGEDMVAVHNLSADNLRHSLKMGGIASPSMAIVDVTKTGFDSFGEITLVASKDLVDPRKGAKVFGSDAYSPRYPDITTEIPKETSGKIKEFLMPYETLAGEALNATNKRKQAAGRGLIGGFTFYDLASKIEDGGWARGAEDHTGLQAAYLKEKGLLPNLGDVIAKETNPEPYWKGRAVQDAIRKAVREEPEVQKDFKEWINDLPEREGWEIEEKIFRGFTPAGSRKYQPHTLENVVKIMKRNIRGGEGFNYGVGTVRSKVSPQFRSVAQIKKNRGKLTDPTSMEAVKNEASHQMGDLADAMEPHLKYKPSDGYFHLGTFSEHLMEAAERGVRSLRDYYDEGAPFEKVTEFLYKLKDLPTGYFEAKIPRAVQLEEFKAAIIPSDLDPKLKKVLEERGLELREYDRKDRLTRKETLQKQTEEADLRFMPAPTFYSKAERAVEGAKGGVFDKGGMTTVEKAVALATKGIPKAEYEWSGVVDWLEGRKEEGASIVRSSKEIIQKMKSSIEGEPIGYKRGSEMHKKDIAETKESIAFWEKTLVGAEEQAAGKVSKAELLEFLQNKGVKVEEVYRGGSRPKDYDVSVGFVDTTLRAVADKGITEYNAGARDTEGNVISYKVISGENGLVTVDSYTGDRPVFHAEVESLRDASLAIEKDMISRYKKESTVPEGAEGPTLFKPTGGDLDVVLPGGENYGELVLTLPEGRAKTGETFELPGAHRFPESNILVHIRFTDRIDADGKRMLFIEELQSDWSNEGRTRGWKQERPAEVQKEIQRLKVEREEKVLAKAEEIGLFNELYGNPDKVSIEAKKDAVQTFREGHSPFDAEYYPETAKAFRMKQQLEESVSGSDTRIAELEEKYPHKPSGAPDMPFKGDNRYGALAMKRMIRWAADNGYERLGWITGKDTADRYNLSKHVDRIELRPMWADDHMWTAEKRVLQAFDKEGNIVLDKVLAKEADIEEYIGKGVTKKLIEAEPKKVKTSHPGGVKYEIEVRSLSNLELDVSPEWPINLYDKVLPSQAKKIVKKKGAVGRTRLRQDYTPEDLKDNVKHKDLEEELKKSEKELNRLELSRPERRNNPNWRTEGNRLYGTESIETAISEMRGEILSLKGRIDRTVKSPEANYVDITPEVKALAQEGFSYFMPPGGGRGRPGRAPMQMAAPELPATPVMPKVKLTEEEKEDSRRLLNLLKEKGI
jgi:hypothetical protein